MPNNCAICQDAPCTKSHCVKKPYKITCCVDCPVGDFCLFHINGTLCNKYRAAIEKTVNERSK